jgi:hypothetical protein
MGEGDGCDRWVDVKSVCGGGRYILSVRVGSLC